MSQFSWEKVLPLYTTVTLEDDFTLDDAVDEYEHVFTLNHPQDIEVRDTASMTTPLSNVVFIAIQVRGTFR